MIDRKIITLGIVDDHNLFRKGLIRLINLGDKSEKYKVIFESENGMDLKIKLASGLYPNIVLMDIDMPDMDGFQTAEWMRENYPDIHILVISMFASPETIIKMLRLGVKGYLSKDIEVEDMHTALDSISEKGFYYSEWVSSIMAHAIEHGENQSVVTKGSPNIDSQVTAHEKEFLALVCTDLTYQEIADKLYLSPKTIDGYRETLFRRFAVKNRVTLALYAVRNGIVEL